MQGVDEFHKRRGEKGENEKMRRGEGATKRRGEEGKRVLV